MLFGADFITYNWENGRRLESSAHTVSNKIYYTRYHYDANGNRTKIVDDLKGVYKYFYVGNTLTRMEITPVNSSATTTLHFTYDGTSPASVNYNGTEYFYLKNALGDICGIVDSAGNLVVEYTYDAWGNALGTTGSMAGTLGEDNPFRYRGYIYDVFTGLYFLGSRYYSPEMGRFISADGYVDTGVGITGTNMFAYCNNNPV